MSTYRAASTSWKPASCRSSSRAREPQELLEWALERFSPRIGLSTAFQIDGVALIDMAYELDPEIEVFTVDTGRLPEETFELVEQLRDRYPGLNLQLLTPEAGHVRAMVARARPEPLLPGGREAAPLLQRPQGPAADPAPGHARCVDHRSAPRPVGDQDGHPEDRDRPRPRSDRQAQPARRVDRGGGLGLRPRARRSVPPPLRPRVHVDRLRSLHPGARTPARSGRDGRWWWESNAPKECGIHCAVETGGLEHELRALIGAEA